jgi:hypothetical protein
MIQRVREIATEACAGQLDKADESYMGHLARVARSRQ